MKRSSASPLELAKLATLVPPTLMLLAGCGGQTDHGDSVRPTAAANQAKLGVPSTLEENDAWAAKDRALIAEVEAAHVLAKGSDGTLTVNASRGAQLGDEAKAYVQASLAQLNPLIKSGRLKLADDLGIAPTTQSRGRYSWERISYGWYGFDVLWDEPHTRNIINDLNLGGQATGAGLGFALSSELGGFWGAAVGAAVGGLPAWWVSNKDQGRGVGYGVRWGFSWGRFYWNGYLYGR